MKKFRRMGQQAEKKDQTERVTGLGRRTREEIVKWNQMTALRFQTRGRHQTSQSPFGGTGRTGPQNFSLRHKAIKFLKKMLLKNGRILKTKST